MHSFTQGAKLGNVGPVMRSARLAGKILSLAKSYRRRVKGVVMAWRKKGRSVSCGSMIQRVYTVDDDDVNGLPRHR